MKKRQLPEVLPTAREIKEIVTDLLERPLTEDEEVVFAVAVLYFEIAKENTLKDGRNKIHTRQREYLDPRDFAIHKKWLAMGKPSIAKLRIALLRDAVLREKLGPNGEPIGEEAIRKVVRRIENRLHPLAD